MTVSVVTNLCQSYNIFRLMVFQWIICSCGHTTAQTYGLMELCGSSRSDKRISVIPGSPVRLELTLDDATKPAIVGCEITVQTAHRGDGLLLSYERFDFAGSNSAAVFHGPDCGTMQLKAWHGETHYTSTCLGIGLERAPAMTTFSPLGVVRFRLAAAEPMSNDLSLNRPINFSVIATASRIASTTTECPSGCCVEPYVFRCPLLDQCIDRKSMCSDLPICGQHGPEPSNNGRACNVSKGTFENREAMNGLVDTKRVKLDGIDERRVAEPRAMDVDDMSVPLWLRASDSSSDPTSIGNRRAEERQIFYSKVEMVCGVLSIALFCLAGIAVFTCRSSRQRATSAFVDDSRRTSFDEVPSTVGQSETTNGHRSDATSQQTMSIENETCHYATRMTPTRAKPCRSCPGHVIGNCPGCLGGVDPAPPSYDSLYPQHHS